jgi:protein TonB
MGLTLFFAGTIHAVAILGISFSLEDRATAPPADRTLDVMVVQNRSDNIEPDEADFLAQTNQEGGGEEQDVVRPRTATPILSDQDKKREAVRNMPLIPPPQPKKPPVRRVLSIDTLSDHKVARDPANRPTPPTNRRLNVAQILASTNQEISRLTAELNRKTEAYAKRPRHKHISARTKEYKYASYLDAWRRKVERVGNLNYPDEARRQRLHGSLILHVALRSNGTIINVWVRRSSGHKLLDDAAVRIVKLAAPYAPFPAEIRKETDVLDITRTWQFLSSNRLLAK